MLRKHLAESLKDPARVTTSVILLLLIFAIYHTHTHTHMHTNIFSSLLELKICRLQCTVSTSWQYIFLHQIRFSEAPPTKISNSTHFILAVFITVHNILVTLGCPQTMEILTYQNELLSKNAMSSSFPGRTPLGTPIHSFVN